VDVLYPDVLVTAVTEAAISLELHGVCPKKPSSSGRKPADVIFSPSCRAQSPQDRHRGAVRACHLNSERCLYLIPGRKPLDESEGSVDTDLGNPAARKLGGSLQLVQ
jgi:hypothetical protein